MALRITPADRSSNAMRRLEFPDATEPTWEKMAPEELSRSTQPHADRKDNHE